MGWEGREMVLKVNEGRGKKTRVELIILAAVSFFPLNHQGARIRNLDILSTG